jgi:hypothetical protein
VRYSKVYIVENGRARAKNIDSPKPLFVRLVQPQNLKPLQTVRPLVPQSDHSSRPKYHVQKTQ